MAAAKRRQKGRVRSQWTLQYNHLKVKVERGVVHSGSSSSLTREHHLHQISLLDVTSTSDKLQDVVGGGVMFEQQNLVVDAVKAALWEL